MKLTTENRADVAIVRVGESRMMYPLLNEFSTEVTGLIGKGTRKVIIDLSGVGYIDSATIGCLVEIHRLVADLGGALRLSSLQRRVHGMLSMTGVDRFLEIFEDTAEALASFGRSEDRAHQA